MCYAERTTRSRRPGKKEKETGRRGAGVDRQLFRIQYVRMAATSDWLLSSRANEGAWSKPVERCVDSAMLISIADYRS